MIENIIKEIMRIKNNTCCDTAFNIVDGKFSGKNEFVILIKPECFAVNRTENIEKVVDLILEVLKKNNVSIGAYRIFNGEYSRIHSLIENEYYILNRGARYGLSHIAYVNRERINKSNVGKIILGAYGFLALSKKFNEESLEQLTEITPCAKIGNGTYTIDVEEDGNVYTVINPFHPFQLTHFNATGSITVALMCRSDTTYAQLASEMIGHYIPSMALQQSIRGKLFLLQKELDIQINNLYNGVHISPSPLEGAIGFYRYWDKNLYNLLGQTNCECELKRSLKNKVDLISLSENPTFYINGEYQDLFGAVEGKDLTEVADVIKNGFLYI